ncbi:hypothetical protein SAMN04488564_103202 [Lentzea waywayandensis]|uniref:Transcriptional regulator, AbiEi antitoxin, Type IV TA system n=1 Tax=Lentzea waywayandensis TaxID=84724 RepID=A0A1I6DW50_9PSEU|nr:hypothetical protein [Lentzea waywayandensis]SFR09683.1 hypothetical protein SAMN04488564_103202 [Lentzea waywayandensis]
MRIEHLRERSDLGVISAGALKSLGVTNPWRRCTPGGPWQRMYPGVVLLHNGPPTPDQQLTAALLRAGPGAVVTGAEACRRHGLPARTPELHVLVPGTARGSGTLILERASPMPTSSDVGGYPVVSAARAVVDTCRFLRSEDEATALIAAAVQRGRCTPLELWAQARTNRFGTKLVRTVLRELGRAESVAERDARRLSRKIRLTTPHWNATIAGADGVLIGRPDAWYDDVGLAWEIDSKAFHFGPRDYARTLARNSRYAAAGILVVQTLPTRLRDDQDAVARELKAAHRAAAARPRPPVHVVVEAS